MMRSFGFELWPASIGSLKSLAHPRHPRFAQYTIVTRLNFGEAPALSLPNRAVSVFHAIDQDVFLERVLCFIRQRADIYDVARTRKTKAFEFLAFVAGDVHA